MENKQSKSYFNTKTIVLYGLLMALTTVVTMTIKVPVPATEGYLNLGDGILMFAGLIFGPVGGFIVGGIGSALADIIGGYLHWAPWTFLIKGMEGLIVALLYRKLFKERFDFISAIIAGIFMATGYFLVEIFMYKFPSALAGYPLNILQGVVGAIIATILFKILKDKIKL